MRRQRADWLSVVPEQARLAMLAHLTQWDIKEMTDKKRIASTCEGSGNQA
ncbi:glucose uptake inhibitor SgrT [Serratia ureilytica]